MLVAAPTVDFAANLPGFTVDSFSEEKQLLYTSAISNLINGMLFGDVLTGCKSSGGGALTRACLFCAVLLDITTGSNTSLAKVDVAYLKDAGTAAGRRRLRGVEEDPALDVGTRVTFLGSSNNSAVSQRAQRFTSIVLPSIQGVVA